MLIQVTFPKEDGTVYFHGLDVASKCIWWTSTPQRLDQIKEGSNIVIKVTGASYWSGRGEQKYSGTEFWVLNVIKIDEEHQRFICTQVVEIPVRKKNE